MKLSMHRYFILLAMAVLIEFNKIASCWRRWGSNVKCAGFFFNEGNVNCGGHMAKTCSLCPCDGRGTWSHLFCNSDCQWSGDHLGGVCHMRKKPKIVDCQWEQWGRWTSCQQTCGGGIKTSTRRIKKQAQNGGKDCVGRTTKTQQCNTNSCPGMT